MKHSEKQQSEFRAIIVASIVDGLTRGKVAREVFESAEIYGIEVTPEFRKWVFGEIDGQLKTTAKGLLESKWVKVQNIKSRFALDAESQAQRKFSIAGLNTEPKTDYENLQECLAEIRAKTERLQKAQTEPGEVFRKLSKFWNYILTTGADIAKDAKASDEVKKHAAEIVSNVSAQREQVRAAMGLVK